MTHPPPAGATPEPPAAILCPFCASSETELFALFGQFLLASQYYCRSCKTVFDVLRWEATRQDYSTDSQAEQPPTDAGR
jgi:hypothetical protein